MKFTFLMLFLTFFGSDMALANNSETVKVIRVYKGDTFQGINYKGVAKIYHLAGVDCIELDNPDGQSAAVYLNQLILNRQVYVTTTVDTGTHALAWVSQTEGGGGLDIGAKMLQEGKCWYRGVDSDNLRPVQRASYELLQNRAKYKKIGIWKNGMYFSTVNPDSWRAMENYKYDQVYINGASNPSLNDFGRPATMPQAPSANGRSGPGDWRKPIVHISK